MNLSTVKWAQWDKIQSRELLGLFICVCIALLCTIVAHNIAQNRHDNFPSYPLDNHHCSDYVYLREGGLNYYYHHLLPLYRTICIRWHPQLRTGGFCWRHMMWQSFDNVGSETSQKCCIKYNGLQLSLKLKQATVTKDGDCLSLQASRHNQSSKTNR